MATAPRHALATLLLGIAAISTAQAQQECDRVCMKGVVDSYLAALVAHDPTRAPLATIYRHTESDVVQNITARRWHVIDVEQQVVVASALFIREPGHSKRHNHFCDVFYVDGGKLRGLYTAMYYVPPTRAVPNWPPYPGNFPLPPSFGATR